MDRGSIGWISFLISALCIGVCAGGSAVRAATPDCTPQTKPEQDCSCDLRSLRPLQGAIGLGEVRAKADKIVRKPDKERKDLAEDPIKVVRGPGGDLFITDHHHGARAWLLAEFPTGICMIQKDGPSANDPARFWRELKDRHLVRLADKDGKPLAPDALPASLEALPDDPYRTLAWMVREDGGFCRALMPQKEFAEFVWADWLRTRVPLTTSDDAARVRTEALRLVESPAAKDQPGYRGDRPAGFKCPKDKQP